MENFFSIPFLFGEEILNRAHIFAGTWLDWLMVGVTSLGSENFYLLSLPLLYWCWDKKKAIYTGAVFLVAISLNDIMKTVFQHPRPDPAKLLPGIRELATQYMPNEPGFPSGHAQGSVAFWGSLALSVSNRAAWAICSVIIILVSYSRLYLGVHYTGDVMGGFLLGLACLAAVFPFMNVTAKHYHRYHPAAVIAVLIIAPIAAVMFLPGNMLSKDMGTISGFLIGAYLAEKEVRFNPRNRIVIQLAKIGIGIAGLAAIRFGLKAVLPDLPITGFFRYWLIGAWVSIGAPYVFSNSRTLRGETTPAEKQQGE
jgi:membrane-associated phospholipid phosphatase